MLTALLTLSILNLTLTGLLSCLFLLHLHAARRQTDALNSFLRTSAHSLSQGYAFLRERLTRPPRQPARLRPPRTTPASPLQPDPLLSRTVDEAFAPLPGDPFPRSMNEGNLNQLTPGPRGGPDGLEPPPPTFGEDDLRQVESLLGDAP